ncbi:MAG: 4-hydroxy-tetrahydrodipicolinate reductase [Winogradskyella sp.]|uniref:4-hydroxy-tetrahydrodipicolinate reductase n=1 Tax=Winogradskyella sp. TaxID=1883156 RepID=UPI0017AFF71D|nr:4-hydroxy-tetrahydrodipicolinate reductase [Winogradskyella sp.]MBT8245508.1 4-hydroxy-tetrahydrodipicolinate reductase [Winogradskyella sp.]NNK23893.1 4-hydroxy-tetrahydrodipicolinate reductase [Winogradskyella sp.]
MKIALLGYGRMGKIIEHVATERGHSISIKADSKTKTLDFSNTDVAIDFSLPSTAVSNIKAALDNSIPVISGTTGWLDNYDAIVSYCTSKNGAFLYASNFSLGVNIFFEVNHVLAKLIGNYPNYKLNIGEIHHTQKLDAPSGTAITLAEDIIKNSDYQNWTMESPGDNEIEIEAKRIVDVPGTHVINYNSDVDSIQIKHTAHNREGFALGAVIAAEWIANKKGIFSMKNVLNIG